MIRVLIADDHPLLREGLKHILADCNDIAIAGEVGNGSDVLAKVRSETFDVVLLDMFMPGKSGIDLIRQVKSEKPKLPILVFSSHKEDIFAVRAIKAGASGYLCKDYVASSLVEALRKVARGGCYISPVVAELMAQNFQPSSHEVTPHALLSDREYQIFLLIVAGKGLTEIAEQLNLSVKTVSTHKVRIKEKMKLDNIPEFVRYAISHGLMPEAGGPLE
jgi:two-component system, NarL family, invasion response regulator UvrY